MNRLAQFGLFTVLTTAAMPFALASVGLPYLPVTELSSLWVGLSCLLAGIAMELRGRRR